MRRALCPTLLFGLGLLAWAGPAPAMAQAGEPQCLLDQAAPPPPADGTVVLAARTNLPQASNPDGFDVVVIPADGNLHGAGSLCDGAYALAVLHHPTVIAVGKRAAIQFWDVGNNLYSDWGAVSDDSAPVLFPDRPDFTPFFTYTADPATFLDRVGSCRGCALSGGTIIANRAGQPSAASSASTAYGYDLSGAQLDGTTWQVLDDEGNGGPVQLPGSNLTNANLSGAQGLQGANLSQANLSGAILDPTDLSGANLTGATLHTHLEHVIGLGSATLASTDLSGATLNGLDLSGARLNHTIVSGAVFDGSDLRGAQLVGLQFQAAPSFNGVIVGQSNGTCTVFQDTDLRDANLTLVQATPGCASSPLLPASTVPVDFIAALHADPSVAANVDLSQANFIANARNRSSLAGLDLHGINLSGASFIGWPVDLSGATLGGASLQGTSFPQAELAGATFHNAQAAGAVFRGAHLGARGSLLAASFAGSQTNLQGADFIEADVSGASFASADLSADASGKPTAFDRALAAGTDFTGVNAKQASFNGAHIYGNGRAFDQATDLSGVDFTSALLAGDVTQGSGFDLAGAPLAGAHFDGAQCIGCNFTGAHLDGATFVGAYLPGAVLSNATLGGTNLDNAWLYCGDLQNSACPSVAGASAASPARPSPTLIPRPTSSPGAVAPQIMGRLVGAPGDRATPDARPDPKPAVIAAASPSPRAGPRLAATPIAGGTWTWALDLGFGEVYGPVPFTTTDLTGVSLVDLAYCPDGNPPDQSSGCVGDALLPTVAMTTPPIPCSPTVGQPAGRGAVALGACPTWTTTLFDASSVGTPLSVAAASPPAWATALTARGFYVGLDDGTVRLVGDGDAQIVAGQPGQHCADPTGACGDGGPATNALLGTPAGLTVGLDGTLYVADPTLHRVRRIDPTNYAITTVAGSGQVCSQPDAACGDGGPASDAALGGPDGVWIDPNGILWIADDRRGLRAVGADGTIASVGVAPGAYTVRSVVGDGNGHLYAAVNDPDYLLEVTPPAPPVTACQQLGLAPGSLIQASGATEIDIVNLSCQRQPLPDAATQVQIQTSYGVTLTQFASADWQRIPAGTAIPDVTTDPIGFTQAVWAILRPACARLVLAPGDLIQASRDPEVDIVDLTCQRRHVPDGATVQQIAQTYNVGITQIPEPASQAITAGSDIPSATTNLAGFAQAMWGIFRPACAQLNLAPGALMQGGNPPEIDILDLTCQRRHVPNPATQVQIQQTYNAPASPPLSQSDWEAISVGPAIPDSSSDLPEFAQAMEQIFGSPCVQLSLNSGTLISVSGDPEIDILDQGCQRRWVPNTDTLTQILRTYNPVPSAPPLSRTEWNRVPAGPAIPDYDTDPTDFQNTIAVIFGSSSTSVSEAPVSRRVVSREAVQVVGQAAPVVGTGTSGYDGTVDELCNLLPGDQVQVDHPAGLSVRSDGAVLFADTGNNLVRVYVPAYGHVVDLGGQIDTTDCPTQGTPTAGFNGDGQWADLTELDGPQGVTTTGEAESLFVVADTGNARVRLLGPVPLDESAARGRARLRHADSDRQRHTRRHRDTQCDADSVGHGDTLTDDDLLEDRYAVGHAGRDRDGDQPEPSRHADAGPHGHAPPPAGVPNWHADADADAAGRAHRDGDPPRHPTGSLIPRPRGGWLQVWAGDSVTMLNMRKRRLVVGISGASGSIYAIRLLEVLRPVPDIETHLVISNAGKRTLLLETDYAVADLQALANRCYPQSDVGAAIASGSFRADGMVVIPCSMKTVSGIATSYSDSLLLRAADVTLKERRRLVLVVRETPLHLGHLRLLTQVTELGAIVQPPVPAFYTRPTTLEDIVNHTVARVLDVLGIELEHDLAPRWDPPALGQRLDGAPGRSELLFTTPRA